MRQGKAVRQVETAGVVTSIEVSQDGRHVTTADGQHVRIWDGTTMEPVKSFKVGFGPLLVHICNCAAGQPRASCIAQSTAINATECSSL